ncbi:protein kinase [Streptomyces sp. Z26]|uniref:serine/threonine-protein kinase n=1 Tax=Streptomyces sp. Z26 TaxID=2500177 RepID=UPI003204EE6C
MDGGADRRVIDERFELRERLGGGGMGLVWRARDLALHRDVALKEVRPPDPELLRLRPDAAEMLRKRVMREAVSLARVNHPRVVTIHHIVTSAEHPWLVMELVTGGSLQDRLDRGPLTPAEAAELGRGVLEALCAAHAVGVLHRDVKPANVLLRPDGGPVLTDFGIAAVRESTNLTNTGELVGSPDYMAPERLRGHDDDAASDLWSLALMLYVAVEGRHPLRRTSTLATLAAILEEDVPPATAAGPLAPVLAAVLRRDPAARPDAAALDRMLAEAAGARTSTAPSSPAPGPVPAHGPGGGIPGAGAPRGTPAPPADPRTPWGSPAADPRPQAPTPGAGRPPEPDTAPPTAPGPPGAGAGVDPGSAPTGPGGPGAAARGPGGFPGLPRGARLTMLLSGPVLTITLGLVFWQVLPGTDDGGGRSDRSSSPGATAPAGGTDDGNGDDADDAAARTPGADTPATPEEEKDLLTPAGVRRAIGALEPLMKGTVVKDFTLHPSHVSAEAPVKDGKAYDRFSYQFGKAERATSGGGVMGDDRTVDLDRYDWDRLPALFSRAEKELGIDAPKSSHLIVEPSDVFHGDQPTMRLYVSDDYGSAYL